MAVSHLKHHVRKLPAATAAGSFVVLALAFGLVLSSRTVEMGEGSIPSQPDVALDAALLNAQPPPVAGDSPRLFIDSLGVNMPIVEGKNDKILLKGAWRSPYSSTPDKGGNTVLFGHRWLHKPPHPETFYDLDKLKVGDTFTVDWQSKRYTYKVTEALVVNPKDVWVLKQTAKPTLTLITCTPLYSTKQRLVIRAELVPSS